MSPEEPPSRSPEPPTSRFALTDAQTWVLVGLAIVVLLAILAVIVLPDDDGDEDEAVGTTTTSTTTEPTTTTTTEATTTTTFAPAVDPFSVAFPAPDSSRSFESAPSAARAYATDVLGFSELVLGPAQDAGDGTTEVVVQDREDGPETTVQLLQHESGPWYVLGSTTPDIVVNQPTAGASLATPFETAGEALAFEGNVEVLVLGQTDPVPLGTGTVTGSGVPPAGPFSGRISYAPPAEATAGILVYRVHSPEDGRVVQATSLRVRLTALQS